MSRQLQDCPTIDEVYKAMKDPFKSFFNFSRRHNVGDKVWFFGLQNPDATLGEVILVLTPEQLGYNNTDDEHYVIKVDTGIGDILEIRPRHTCWANKPIK